MFFSKKDDCGFFACFPSCSMFLGEFSWGWQSFLFSKELFFFQYDKRNFGGKKERVVWGC